MSILKVFKIGLHVYENLAFWAINTQSENIRPGIMVSGNTANRIPSRPHFSMALTTFSVVASRFISTGDNWIAATRIVLALWSMNHSLVQRILTIELYAKEQYSVNWLNFQFLVLRTTLFESEIGVLSRLTADIEFESMAEIEKTWNEIGTKPEYESFLEKWRPLIVSSERTV